jgi:hypothetical protein
MSDFKVGDIAKAKYGNRYTIATDGWEGVVREVISPDGIKVQWEEGLMGTDGETSSSDTVFTVLASEFTKLPAVPIADKLEVGQVRVIKSLRNAAHVHLEMGDVVKIVREGPNDSFYARRLNPETNHFNGPGAYVRLDNFLADEAEEPVFAKGVRVRVTGDSGFPAGPHTFSVGDEGVIISKARYNDSRGNERECWEVSVDGYVHDWWVNECDMEVIEGQTTAELVEENHSLVRQMRSLRARLKRKQKFFKENLEVIFSRDPKFNVKVFGE